MTFLVELFWIVYALILAVLSLYGLHRLWILYLYFRYHKFAPPIPIPENPASWPKVTVQLPLYNEAYVVERLLAAIAALDYPKELLEIQILDDSTDETQDLTQLLADRYIRQGYSLRRIHRTHRDGYKAGALQAGLARAQGEFIAVFDADFLPQADFLKKTIPHFQDSSIAMVQARWGHINRNYSLLTRLQALFLDGHFVLEHTARNRSQSFFNFNGTAGVWRKTAVAASGGWQHDTLTEDLDLSYRAQLAGWKFLYLPDVVCPGELPVDITAFKSQQHRWTKGALQTAKKLLPLIWKSELPWAVKLEATAHLTSNLGYLLLVVASLLMLPALFLRTSGPEWTGLAAFLFTALALIVFYAVSQWEAYPDWKSKLKDLPVLLALGLGICFNNARGCVEALCNQDSEFRRTPKFAITGSQEIWKNKKYRTGWNPLLALEWALVFYFAFVLWKTLQDSDWGTLPFAFVLFAGCAYVAFLSLLHSRVRSSSV